MLFCSIVSPAWCFCSIRHQHIGRYTVHLQGYSLWAKSIWSNTGRFNHFQCVGLLSLLHWLHPNGNGSAWKFEFLMSVCLNCLSIKLSVFLLVVDEASLTYSRIYPLTRTRRSSGSSYKKANVTFSHKTDEQKDIHIDVRTYTCIHIRTYVHTYKTRRQTDGRMDGRTDKQTGN